MKRTTTPVTRRLGQLTRSGLVTSGFVDDLQRLRAQFDREHYLRWPGFLSSDLLTYVERQVDEGEFEQTVHNGIGVELCLRPNVALSLLHFLTNDPALFRLVDQITGCGRIGCFTGRVYRMLPDAGHYDSWHTDSAEHRIIGMSLNLSTGVYGGGVLRLRKSGSSEILSAVANTGPADAILFRIADDLFHCVSPVTGTVPKTAFAGWFRSEPEFLSLLR